MFDRIRMPDDGRPVAEQSALDAARSDGGLRIAIACAITQRDTPPWAAAQSSGLVYETADRVARLVEERDTAVSAAALRDAAAIAEKKPGPTWPPFARWLRRLADEIEQETSRA